MSVIGKLDELKKTPFEFNVTYTDSLKQKEKYEHVFCLDFGFVNNNQQLLHEEFKGQLDALAAISMKFTRSETQSLSDYAVSREGIYEGNPKL